MPHRPLKVLKGHRSHSWNPKEGRVVGSSRETLDFLELLVYTCCPHTVTTVPLVLRRCPPPARFRGHISLCPKQETRYLARLPPLALVCTWVLDGLIVPSGFRCSVLSGRGLCQKRGGIRAPCHVGDSPQGGNQQDWQALHKSLLPKSGLTVGKGCDPGKRAATA